MHHFCSVFSG